MLTFKTANADKNTYSTALADQKSQKLNYNVNRNSDAKKRESLLFYLAYEREQNIAKGKLKVLMNLRRAD